MGTTLDHIVEVAKTRGFSVQYKIDSANNSQYPLLKKDGNQFPLRYVEKDRIEGVRTHVGSLKKDFDFEAEEFLDWYDAQMKARNRDIKFEDFVDKE